MANFTVGKVVGGCWMRHWWRALLAEMFSTALLVWLGCAPLVPIVERQLVLTHPAFSFGFVVVANICAFGEVSGAHMNPAVTLGALLYGQIEMLPALAYVLAQLLGSIIGFGGLMVTSPPELIAAGVAVTLPGKGISPLAAMGTETAMTFTLVIAACGVWASQDSKHPDNAAALKLGVVIAGLIYAGGPATGAGINPARSFAPALLQGIWQHHWVYWVGPLLGSTLGALVHRWALTSHRDTTATRPAANIEATHVSDKP